ncbi:MAG TPA: 4-alpha-glucanotransferase [Myxococcales bacterium]|nr:4-alpha-glucanotransferase [Myxococcales bacterium]
MHWQRAAGVLLHPSSLPGPHGMGDLGPEARRFVEWLARARGRVWQVLPLGPTGGTNACNPYVSWSPLAGNPLLLSLHDLRDDGLIDSIDGPQFLDDRIDYARVFAWKAGRVRAAAERLVGGHPLREEWRGFVERSPWARDTALFASLKKRHGSPWWQWPAALRRCEPPALEGARVELAREIDLGLAGQFLFERQWRTLRAFCRERGIRILGDVPIYLAHDSADVWLHQELFRLQPDGTPTAVGGAPPDVFSPMGQRWGCPVYDWARIAPGGYPWWRARFARALEHADLVRIDHFRAFSAYWEIPAGSPTAAGGHWVAGPGMHFFDSVRAGLGLAELPFCAEDLGTADAELESLLRATGFPGMRILQFAFSGDASNPHLPHNHVENCVVYPGNHDNDTVAGWWASMPAAERSRAQHYLGRHGDDIAWDLIRVALASVARTAIVQAQDLLALSSQARMNTPTSYGLPPERQRNWGWRMSPGALTDFHAERFRQLCELYGRA